MKRVILLFSEFESEKTRVCMVRYCDKSFPIFDDNLLLCDELTCRRWWICSLQPDSQADQPPGRYSLQQQIRWQGYQVHTRYTMQIRWQILATTTDQWTDTCYNKRSRDSRYNNRSKDRYLLQKPMKGSIRYNNRSKDRFLLQKRMKGPILAITTDPGTDTLCNNRSRDRYSIKQHWSWDRYSLHNRSRDRHTGEHHYSILTWKYL